MYESLHNHTGLSDGAQTYAELFASAQRLDLGVLALTDHDTLPGAAELAWLRDYDGPVKWLIGCEITSGLPRELGGGPTGMLHVLGLFTDPSNQALVDHCRLAVAARTERMEAIVANLQGIGLNLTVDDCLRESRGEAVGRPHIVKALNRYPENQTVIEALVKQMAAAAVTSPAVAMDYLRMTERHKSDYPYRLFLSEDAFIPGIYVDYRYNIDLDTSVGLIRQSGGRAILAHWPTISRKIDAALLETLLAEDRLDGVELRSGYNDDQVARQDAQLVAMVERTGRVGTIGIDGHSEADLERFVADRALAERTVGQTARLVERFRPDLSSCSSL